jgi:hypothetical protein
VRIDNKLCYIINNLKLLIILFIFIVYLFIVNGSYCPLKSNSTVNILPQQNIRNINIINYKTKIKKNIFCKQGDGSF